jgi:hypothetical protein
MLCLDVHGDKKKKNSERSGNDFHWWCVPLGDELLQVSSVMHTFLLWCSSHACSSRPANQFYRFVRCRVLTSVEQHGFMAKRMAANPIDPLDPIMPRHYFMFIYSAYAYVLSLWKVSRILAGLTRSVYLLPDLYT